MSRMTRRTVIPVNQITPLTYRDGVTYIQLLTELSDYIKSILHPSLQHTVDQLVADVETQMDKHHDQYVDGVQEFQRIHDAFMSDVNAKLIALNDGAVSDIVRDDESRLSAILRERFPSTEDFATFKDAQNLAFTGFRGEVLEENRQLRDDNTTYQAELNDALDQLGTRVDGIGATVDDVLATRLAYYGKTPYDYGAMGDGEHDDTQSLQSWLDHGGGFLPYGRYKITDGVNITGDHVTIQGYGKPEILYHGNMVAAFRIYGNYAHVSGIRFNGLGRGYIAVYMEGHHAEIHDNIVHDFYHRRNCRAFDLRGDGGYSVRRNVVSNIYASDKPETSGTGEGMTRAVAIHNPNPRDMQYPSVVSDNYFERIFGYEGDMVTVHTQLAVSGTRYSAYTTVKNNVMNSASRRFVKIQASEVVVKDNTIFDTIRDMEHEGSLSPITVYDGLNPIITGNVMYATTLTTPISLRGSSAQQSGGMITHNWVYAQDVAYGIRVEYYNNVQVSNNSIRLTYRGSAIRFTGCNDSIIANNSVSGTRSTSDTYSTFYADGPSRRVLIANNVDGITPSRSTSVSNNSVGGKTVNNVKW